MQPVCLIRQGADGLEVVPEGEALLQSLQLEPLAIVCLAGQYRTGKSFFLNQMCQASGAGGFVVGPTTESCTRGIWIWDANVRNDRGEKVLLMDTEGIASTDNDESYDAKIFSLGLLLSSVFVFNTMGVIDEGAIDRLFLVSELTKHVCLTHNPTTCDASKTLHDHDDDDDFGPSEAELAPHFPPFVWLLRDFLLDIQENGVALSPKTYLERSLEPRDGASRRTDERNRIRASIRTLFAQRECMTLVRPATDEDQLRHASSLTNADLRSEFVTQMACIRARLLALASPKRLLGQVVDGPQLCHLVRAYLATMNSGAVPNIKAAWEYVSDATCETAMQRALDEYHCVMATALGESLRQDHFESTFKSAQDKALTVYKRISVDGDARKRCFQSLKTAITADRTAQIASLQVKSRALCDAVLARAAATMLDAAADDATTSWRARLTPLLAAYDEEADGAAKNKALLSFLRDDVWSFVDAAAARREAAHAATLASTVAAAESRERALESTQRHLETQLHALELENVRAISAAANVQDKLEAASASNVELRSSLESTLAQLEAVSAKEAARRVELDALQQAHTAVSVERAQLGAQLAQTTSALHAVQADRDSIRETLTQELSDERKGRTTERESAIAEMAKQAGELHTAQRALKSAATDHDALSRDLSVLQKEKDMLRHKLDLVTSELATASATLAATTADHADAATMLQRYQKRVERLETQLGDMATNGQVALALEQVVWTVAKQADIDKAVQVVAEEKAALVERLGDLHLKISSLPDFYQRQVFCASEPAPDFFDALTSFLS
ncbi:hypothetical protein SPRG_07082 [Saprolegnia parasitica CBS 223.65]|uniref:GB1/RHD3-type G domain-containing protein n=1 Tax=Saprolegnia parasitica (strain CBS 223.65) TaxID=695850 RepID=A0A067CAF7_SAPPC|nr:hypothetical protein SPRG_07082 [Saprolegnia parasitica CBS 223.65]KDO27493.1 hypothetical protein SPRG_07082 [Saprolegnia parasitica CBS 223.65]|eukprot:XP_012201927.1 hypothetical protein SPRG_07082 [Saprolegnia parasitica CBS 223.65]